MANNYIELSEMITMPTKEITDHLEDSFASACEQKDWYGGDIERESKTELWIYSEEGINVDFVADVIMNTMSEFDLDGCIVLAWAETCSKPRVGEFGGGAVAIYNNKQVWSVTGQFKRDRERKVFLPK